MSRILITSGPTRQYIDPVRFLTNASSGRMGAALAAVAVERGHEVVIVSGPVHVEYPRAARVVDVISTDEMLEACCHEFRQCDGLIGTAAPCDYRPRQIATQKIAKDGDPLILQLIETPDIVATIGARKQPHQWLVGFALETHDQHVRAMVKLEKKSCDLMVLNGPQAIDAITTSVEILDRSGNVLKRLDGTKLRVAQGIFAEIERTLIG